MALLRTNYHLIHSECQCVSRSITGSERRDSFELVETTENQTSIFEQQLSSLQEQLIGSMIENQNLGESLQLLLILKSMRAPLPTSLIRYQKLKRKIRGGERGFVD